MSGAGKGTLTPPEDAGDAGPVVASGAAPPPILNVTEREDDFLVTDTSGTYPLPKKGLKEDAIAFLQGMAHRDERQGRSMEWPTPQGTLTDRDLTAAEMASTEASLFPQPAPVVVDRDLTPEEKAAVDARLAAQHLPLAPLLPPPPPAPPPAPAPAAARGRATPLMMADGGAVPDAGFGQTTFLPLNAFGPPGLDAGVPDPYAQALPSPPLPEIFPVTSAPPAAPPPSVGSPIPEHLLASPEALGIRPVDVLHGGRGVIGPGEVAPTQPAPAPPPPMAPPSLPGVPSQVGELNRGLEEQRAGLEAQVQAQREHDLAVVGLQDQHIKQRMALDDAFREQYAAVQRRADDLFQATLEARIDPNRVWASMDTGQRVGAGIAIILSGIGQGLAGGPNLALQQINRIIDLDIDAQKANLENQRGLLSYYLQQGRDMRSAHELAKADLQDMLAAQMVRVSATFGGDRAAAAAQLAAGQLRTDAAGMRSNMYAQEYQRKLQQVGIQQQMEMNRLLMQVVSAPRTPAGGLQAPPQLLDHPQLKDFRERSVFLPDGSTGFAQTKERAEKLRDGFQMLDTFRQTLGRYRGLLETGHPVLPALLGGDRKMAEATRRDLVAQLAKLENTGVLQKHDLEYLEPLVPDITAIFTSDPTLAQGLDALQNALMDRVDANLRSLRGQ